MVFCTPRSRTSSAPTRNGKGMPEQNNQYRIDKQLARRAFDRAADTYDAVAELQYEIGDRMVERLDYIRQQPRRILDLGAGTGFFTAALLKRYRKADARCVCADAESLPFADDSFDFIFSNLMLQWCTDLESTLLELRRVLAPGGLLMFTTFGPDTLMELRASWEAVDGYTHVNSFVDMHDVGDALLAAQWAEPVMDSERITVTYRELRTLMRDLKHIGAHNVTAGRARGLTGKQHMQQLTEAYERFREDGVLPASYEVVYGHAWSPVNKHATAGNEVSLASLQPPGPAGSHD